ncbi:hypothetical protein EJB05_29263 [Eragrostis curvula]|uniref:Uncharacterized protein n=1 Tax=Eragrostis curvula TaxID=38414 RepID=A0A5J9UUD4_9POAL|nr:hypothetical protein EJB05_29263 [Eragrostis curvula]
MDSATSGSKSTWGYYIFLVLPCHHFLTLVWVRHQILHHTLRQLYIAVNNHFLTLVLIVQVGFKGCPDHKKIPETCALSKIFYDQHLRDYWCPKFLRICVLYDQHLRDYFIENNVLFPRSSLFSILGITDAPI